MTNIRLFASAVIVGVLQSTLFPQGAYADGIPEWVADRLARFGGKVESYETNATTPSWSVRNKTFFAPASAEKFSTSRGTAVTFRNTSLGDLELALLADALAHIPNLQKLDLSYTKVKGESLGLLAGIGSLTYLDLSNTPLCGEGLGELTRLCRLTHVGLNGTNVPLDAFTFFVYRFAHSLKSLDLSGATVFGPGLQPVGAAYLLKLLRQFCHLTHLNVSQALVTPGPKGKPVPLSDLRDLAVHRNLKELDLSNDNLADGAMQCLGTLKNLTRLRLAGNDNLTDAGLTYLWPPGRKNGLHRLCSVDLSGTKMTDKTLWNLADQNRCLRELYLSGTPTLVRQDSAAALDKLFFLNRLDISGTGVDNTLFRRIWQGNPFLFLFLEYLDISATKVTDDGLATEGSNLAVGFPTLKMLFCADTGVTPGGVNHRNALLGLQFLRPIPKGYGFKTLPDVFGVKRVAGRMPR
jgi:hypothetical protein